MIKSNYQKKNFYKRLINLKENVLKRKKLFNFKKLKWHEFIINCEKSLQWYKKYKPRDQNRYTVVKYSSRKSSYKKNFVNILHSTQKFKLLYGNMSHFMLKKEIKFIYRKSNKHKKEINILTSFLKTFEARLDVILWRSKFSNSLRNAKQMISHGQVYINKNVVRNSFYKTAPGDLISIKSSYCRVIDQNIQQAICWPIPPKHLIINYKTMEIIFTDLNWLNFSIYFSFNLNLEYILEHNRI